MIKNMESPPASTRRLSGCLSDGTYNMDMDREKHCLLAAGKTETHILCKVCKSGKRLTVEGIKRNADSAAQMSDSLSLTNVGEVALTGTSHISLRICSVSYGPSYMS